MKFHPFRKSFEKLSQWDDLAITFKVLEIGGDTTKAYVIKFLDPRIQKL